MRVRLTLILQHTSNAKLAQSMQERIKRNGANAIPMTVRNSRSLPIKDPPGGI